MADEDYRAILMEIGKVNTSPKLTDTQLGKVLKRMETAFGRAAAAGAAAIV